MAPKSFTHILMPPKPVNRTLFGKSLSGGHPGCKGTPCEGSGRDRRMRLHGKEHRRWTLPPGSPSGSPEGTDPAHTLTLEVSLSVNSVVFSHQFVVLITAATGNTQVLGVQEVGSHNPAPHTWVLEGHSGRWGAALRTWVAVWLDATSLSQGHLSLRIISHHEPFLQCKESHSPADPSSIHQPKASLLPSQPAPAVTELRADISPSSNTCAWQRASLRALQTIYRFVYFSLLTFKLNSAGTYAAGL